MAATACSSRCRRRWRRDRPTVSALSRLAPMVLIVVIATVVVGAPSAVAAAQGSLPIASGDTARRGLIAHYVAPVDAPVIDHFRPPACLWCSGNRGIDYGTPAGVAVHAAAAGRVSFAGQVGGDLFVVVGHPDGLRTTYGFLGAISVATGDAVAQGQVVGSTAGPLHFGVRRGDIYLDPELLLAGAAVRAHLVPSDGSPARVI